MSDPNTSPGGGSNHESWNQQGYGGGQYTGQYGGQYAGQYQGGYPGPAPATGLLRRGNIPGSTRDSTRRMDPTATAPAAGMLPNAPMA